MAKDISVALELDNKQFNSALKQSSNQVKDFSSKSVESFGLVKGAFAALGGATLIKSIVDVGSRFQDLRNSLRAVYGGAVQANAEFARIQGFAATTQFSVEDLTKAFVQLKGVGVDPTEEMLKTFADTASITIDQLGAFEAMVRLVARSTAGGLGLEELEQLANRAIPVYDILSEKLNITRDEVTEFGKSAEGARKIVAALTEGLRERFGGALEDSADAFSRAANNLGDATNRLKAALFGEIAQPATESIQGLTAAIERLADNTQFISSLANVFKGLAGILAALGGLYIVRKGFATIFGTILGTNRVTTVLSRNLKQLSGNLARVFMGSEKLAKSNGKVIKAANGVITSTTIMKQRFVSLLGAIASASRFLLRFAGILGVVYTAVNALDALSIAIFDVSPIEKVTGWFKAAGEALGFIGEEAPEAAEGIEEAGNTAAEAREKLKQFVEALNIGDSVSKAQQYLEDFKAGNFNTELQNAQQRVTTAQKVINDLNDAMVKLKNSGLIGANVEVQKLTELLNASNEELKDANRQVLALQNLNFDEFFANTKNEIILAENAQARLNDTLTRLRAEADAGTLTWAQYNTALRILGQTYVNVADRVRDANKAFVDFQSKVAKTTDDLQKKLDQLNMTPLEKQQDDIRRNLELLRDDTIAKLKKAMEDLDPDSEAYKKMEQQIKDVTNATAKTIEEQQKLAETSYDASRTFEQGWNDAITNFIENATDGSARAKQVFDTMTKGFEDAIVNFVKTGKLSFKDLVNSMIELLVRSQLQKLMATIFGSMGGGGGGILAGIGKLFGFADGGRPPIGKPSIVGEKGPELFVPNTAGKIIPNDQLGGGTVNNTYITNQISAIDAKSVAQLFAENRKTLLGTVQMAQKEMPYSM